MSGLQVGGGSVSGGEGMLITLMEITKWPPFFRKLCALRATIRDWSGCATSAKITSTMPGGGAWL